MAPEPGTPTPQPLRQYRSTARPAFERVAERLQLDAPLLQYLFAQCMGEILEETQSVGACTLRGLGKFRLTTLAALGHDSHYLLPASASAVDVLVFERTSHAVKNTPFAALRLGSRINKKTTSP